MGIKGIAVFAVMDTPSVNIQIPFIRKTAADFVQGRFTCNIFISDSIFHIKPPFLINFLNLVYHFEQAL